MPERPHTTTTNEVSHTVWTEFISATKNRLSVSVKDFSAGQLYKYVSFWKSITTDYVILEAIQGVKIEFLDTPIPQKWEPCQYSFSDEEKLIIHLEIDKLLRKGVLIEIHPGKLEPQYLSNIFTRSKKDGSCRLILNLKEINESVVYHHFKMDTLKTAINLMTKNCFMASIDWKDAYYTVPVHKDFQKYLRFYFEGKFYQYTVLPNGLACAPRLFTKISKPIFSELRRQGMVNTSYIDDSLLLGDTLNDCRINVIETVNISNQAGFVIHPGKSVFQPVQIIEYLGFILNSINMTVALTPQKKMKLKTLCTQLMQVQSYCKIQLVAQCIGVIVASFPGVLYGRLFYRALEADKILALQLNQGNFDASMTLTSAANLDLRWWIDNIDQAYCPVSHGAPTITLASDASMTGWGGVIVASAIPVKGATTTGGNWSTTESAEHINFLELQAAWFTIRSFCGDLQGLHVRIKMDNTTAIAYINNMGGKTKSCNSLARKIWMWCMSKEIWLSAAHIPGVQNGQADKISRTDHNNTEWQLDGRLFNWLVEQWGRPEIDLFASRLNCQLDAYVSWKPDPFAVAIDAFSITWDKYGYIFPPFSLISKILQKVIEDETKKLIMIVPFWTTQPWFPKLTRMLTDCVFLLPREKTTLTNPHHQGTPLKHMRLIACQVSTDRSKTTAFLQRLKTSSCRHGRTGHKNNIVCTKNNGLTIVVHGISIPLHRAWEM